MPVMNVVEVRRSSRTSQRVANAAAAADAEAEADVIKLPSILTSIAEGSASPGPGPRAAKRKMRNSVSAAGASKRSKRTRSNVDKPAGEADLDGVVPGPAWPGIEDGGGETAVAPASPPLYTPPDEEAIANHVSKKLQLTVMKEQLRRLQVLVKDTHAKVEALETTHATAELKPLAIQQPHAAPLRQQPHANFIRINVGGTVFTTRKSTLARFSGTYLAVIASGNFKEEFDEDGNVFIDRDPKHFQSILNFLRDPTQRQVWAIDDATLLSDLDFYGLRTQVHKGSIYVAYGFDGQSRLSSIECFNPLLRKWTTVANFKCELSSPACAILNGKMYITGGKNKQNRAVPTAAYYDPITRDITVTTDLQTARFGHGLVELDGYIYAVGGYGDDGGRVESVERYDEKSKKWTRMPNLADVRSALGCDALQGKIYVAGGYGRGSQPQSLVDLVEVFDPKAGSWSTAPSLPVPRAHVCCVTYQGKLWAVGGYDGQHASQTVEIYDPNTKEWTTGPSLLKKRSVVVCAVLDDKLYAIGGYDGQFYLSCSEIYDPEAKMWIPGPDMEVSRGRHCVCTLPY